jgi:Haemolysin secretion/activation protein ShlB/FhaC/HecB
MRLPVALLLLSLLGAPGPAVGLTYEPVYPVSEIVVEYALDHPRQIPIEEVLDLEVGLRATDEGYVAPRPVDRTVRMRLSALPAGAKLGASAVLHINQHIVATFNRRGYNGIIVTVPDVEEGSGRDLRAPGDTALHLRIWTGRVSRVTSIADGERFGGLSVDDRTNLPAHAWIREESPVRPGGPRGLLGVEELEDYAAEISRHPGRQMQAELEPGSRAGTTAVNLRIAESKPWYVYAQYSNTGTTTTTLNRQRFGFTHNQLLGRDDILQLDYVTGDFQEVNAFAGSYSSPFTLRAPEWRFAVRGGYSQFDAEETGFTSTKVDGTQSGAGLEISRQIFQHHEFFLDAAAGADWMNVTVENQQIADVRLEADVNYALPYVDLRAARDKTTSTLRARIGVLGGWTPTSDSDLATVDSASSVLLGPPELDVFGAANVDNNFALTRLDASFSFYLEPLIDPWGWEDPNTPESSTLAHEVAFLVRGQYAMGFRVIPQFQQVAGGFTTVRGYKQSAAVGDNLALGSVEYRLHIPRLFRPDSQPPELWGLGAFRWRPPHVYGAPDWDLIFRVFTDAAYVTSSHALASEPDDTLWSVGGGLELQVLRNLILRGDVGYTLHELAGSNGGSGDTRGYVAATVLY